MRLDLSSKYAIESDERCFVVFEKGVGKDKEGKEFETKLSPNYFTTLEGCLKHLVDRTVKTSKAVNNLKQVLDEVNQMKADINRALEPLNGEY